MSKRTRKDLTNSEKIELLDRYRDLPKLPQEEAASRLGIKRGFLRNLLKGEAKLREEKSDAEFSKDRKRQRTGKDGEVEEALRRWLKISRSYTVPVNGPVLSHKAEVLARGLGKYDFKATDDWLTRWKKRYGVTYAKLHGEAAEADVEGANEWRKENVTQLLESYSHSDIFNADETSFQMKEALPEV